MTSRDQFASGLTEVTLKQSVSRRRLLQLTGVAAGTMTLTSLLAACAEEADDDTVDAGEDPATDDDADDTVEDDAVDDDTADDSEDVETEDEPEEDDDVSDDEPQVGGTLRLAMSSEAPPLDIHRSTVGNISFIGWHIFEPLFTWDEDLVLQPDLVDTHEVSDDSLTQTFHLREGVPFHNGDVMDSDDVVASLERWVADRAMEDDIESIEAVDEATVEIATSSPFASLTAELARRNHGCAIYPASVIEEHGEGVIPTVEIVGTGPYRLLDFQPDRSTELERFDDYVGRDEEPSGYWGRKHQYVDEIHFYPTPDEAAMAAGIRAGDYDYLRDVSADQAEQFEGDENVVFELLPPVQYAIFAMNKSQGPLTDHTLRRAIQATLDIDEIALAAFGEGNYRLSPSLMLEEFTEWYTESGGEYYNQANPELGEELLEEAGYDGEAIRFLIPEDPPYMYNGAMMAIQQLESIGLVIDVQVTDFATLSERRQDPSEWEMFSSANSVPGDPVMHNGISPRYPGWWELEEKEELRRRLGEETDHEVRYEIWEQIQELFYTDVNLIKLGENFVASARAPRLRNFNPIGLAELCFWNVWLDD